MRGVWMRVRCVGEGGGVWVRERCVGESEVYG